jgi:hypothetical protein
MMITDMVSLVYGWLESPDGKEKVHVVVKADKTDRNISHMKIS